MEGVGLSRKGDGHCRWPAPTVVVAELLLLLVVCKRGSRGTTCFALEGFDPREQTNTQQVPLLPLLNSVSADYLLSTKRPPAHICAYTRATTREQQNCTRSQRQEGPSGFASPWRWRCAPHNTNHAKTHFPALILEQCRKGQTTPSHKQHYRVMPYVLPRNYSTIPTRRKTVSLKRELLGRATHLSEETEECWDRARRSA